VFGERFWRGSVARLIGSQAATALDVQLDTLERAEVITRSPESRFRDETELVFRHAVVRDAAYAMLTDRDRQLAHALAAEWLEPRIDDAVLLAHHFEVGERPKDAARWHVQAAEDALTANAFETVLVHATRAEELGIDGALAGRAQLARAQVTLWRGTNPDARIHALAAIDLLERGSVEWFTALGIASAATGKLERRDDLVALVNVLEAVPATTEEAGRARAIARARTAMQLVYLGEPEIVARLVAGCEDEPGAAGDPHVRTWMADLKFERAFASGLPIHPREVIAASENARNLGDVRQAMLQEGNYCMTLLSVGAYEEAAKASDALVTRAAFDTTFLDWVKMLVQAVGAAIRGHTRAYEEASELAMKRNVRAGIANRLWLAMLLFQSGHIDHAHAVTEHVFDGSVNAPPFRSIAVALALRMAVRRGDLSRAAVLVAELDRAIHRAVAVWGRAFCDVARVEAHEALGNTEAAREALDFGVAHLLKCADVMEEWRDTFLHARADNAELVEIARRHGITIE
jgi:eukaryotic-like serine/threonine-protein kinase